MKIITVCGSLKFQEEMLRLTEHFELEGHCMLSVVYPARDNYSQEELDMLSKMRREKIKLSDAILVVNPGGYIGENTHSEIEFAHSLGKEIMYSSNHEEEPL